ncbi:hypothetical protein [Tabrizicola sp.]|jgi:hypothetical protein|uniref:hypothetical protein n=1 Tax=Tabrizicola sp. TaxID=2005166 RepID=UPI001A5F6B21|nr:hypothetical protein [Tabrizicola sp.]MBL9064406.1 hypothetical protein [Tabrizicola sp.]
MTQRLSLLATLGTATAALGACAPAGEVPEERGETAVYQGVSTILLDTGMVSFSVAMTGAKDRTDVEAYGRCAAAQYALDQGFGFARQVRTIVRKEGRTWYGDAVYLISASLPEGLRTIDAEVVATECEELGIPTS